jgi:hypothetical protein
MSALVSFPCGWFGAALVPVLAGDASAPDAAVYVPDLPAGVVLGDAPGVFELGDGLQLTLDPSALTPELGTSLHDAAARRLPDDRVPTYPVLGAEVLAVYALHPFAARSSAPGGRVGAGRPGGRGGGAPRAVSHLDGTLSAPVIADVSGGRAVSMEGEGLEWLTHIVVHRP